MYVLFRKKKLLLRNFMDVFSSTYICTYAYLNTSLRYFRAKLSIYTTTTIKGSSKVLYTCTYIHMCHVNRKQNMVAGFTLLNLLTYVQYYLQFP